ncbi:MAG TPA: hypothetical protein VGS04_08110 [Nitrososphaerales archaeon]|nr:hypothetical protein [Nitrososphaerales archaeon]
MFVEKPPFPVVDQVTVPVGELPVTVAVHKIDCPTMTVVEGEHPIAVVVDASPATAGTALTRNKNPETKSNGRAHRKVLILALLLPCPFPS